MKKTIKTENYAHLIYIHIYNQRDYDFLNSLKTCGLRNVWLTNRTKNAYEWCSLRTSRGKLFFLDGAVVNTAIYNYTIVNKLTQTAPFKTARNQRHQVMNTTLAIQKQAEAHF